MPIRVVIAEEQGVVRESLCALLAHEGFEVAAAVSSGEEAVRKCAALRPDVAVLAITLPLLNGIDAAQEIGLASPSTRTVLLTMQEEERFVRKAARAGVAGYVLKSKTAPELIESIREVCRGKLYVSQGVDRELFERRGKDTPPIEDALSPRERQVLQLLAEGKSNKEIGVLLEISGRTVECHRASVMTKLDIHDIPGLVRYAVRRGIIQA